MSRIFWDNDALPIGISTAKLVYDLRRDDAGENLLLDSVTMRDILDDPDTDGLLAFDALVVPYAQLQRKMEVMQRVMSMAGGSVTVTAMQLSEPFKQKGVAMVAAIFELSDGQTVSVYFHNPDTTPAKIAASDELISWKWLLNKKDITIVAAPERGDDLNVREVARRVMKLAEKNSPAFTRANARRADTLQRIEGLKTEIATLETELKDAQAELEVAKVDAEMRKQEPDILESRQVNGQNGGQMTFASMTKEAANLLGMNGKVFATAEGIENFLERNGFKVDWTATREAVTMDDMFGLDGSRIIRGDIKQSNGDHAGHVLIRGDGASRWWDAQGMDIMNPDETDDDGFDVPVGWQASYMEGGVPFIHGFDEAEIEQTGAAESSQARNEAKARELLGDLYDVPVTEVLGDKQSVTIGQASAEGTAPFPIMFKRGTGPQRGHINVYVKVDGKTRYLNGTMSATDTFGGLMSSVFASLQPDATVTLKSGLMKPSKPKKVDPEPEPGPNPETYIGIAANSVKELRKQDVERVLLGLTGPIRQMVSAYIIENRPDLEDEVNAMNGVPGSFRDPTKVSVFNTYKDGDKVKLGEQIWTVKNEIKGWYLTNDGTWRGAHPTIKNVPDMLDFIRMVEQEWARSEQNAVNEETETPDDPTAADRARLQAIIAGPITIADVDAIITELEEMFPRIEGTDLETLYEDASKAIEKVMDEATAGAA